MKITFFFAWFDFWVGFYYDLEKHTLYFCPLPMCVIMIRRKTYIERVLDTHPIIYWDGEITYVKMHDHPLSDEEMLTEYQKAGTP